MPETIIRPVRPADIAAVTAIYGHAVRCGTATFELTPPDEAEMARRFAQLASEDLPSLVALSGDCITGYAYAGRYRARPAYRFTLENSVYLDPAWQRRGIGTALLNELIAQSAGRGFRQMIAVIGDSANAASIGLHARAGFAMIGTLPKVGFKFGRWLDSVLMQRPLGEGGATIPVERQAMPEPKELL